MVIIDKSKYFSHLKDKMGEYHSPNKDAILVEISNHPNKILLGGFNTREQCREKHKHAIIMKT